MFLLIVLAVAITVVVLAVGYAAHVAAREDRQFQALSQQRN